MIDEKKVREAVEHLKFRLNFKDISETPLEKRNDEVDKILLTLAEQWLTGDYVPKKDVEELIVASKEWVQWFDYLCAYQHENLDHGLQEACENWGNMVTPDPSPRITALKSALSKFKEAE